ncbi:cache domain-containing protein [candidate division WOR-3 bacterium]|nr:cache domain-containing protein [candidate division WOR-3 bacterium]
MKIVSLRTKLITGFSLIIIVGVALSVIVGIQLIGSTIIREAQNKVRLDLNSAHEVYAREIEHIETTVRLTAVRFFLKDALLNHDRKRLIYELERIRVQEHLDMLILFDQQGRVILRVRNPGMYGDSTFSDMVHTVIKGGSFVSGTEILPREYLIKEDSLLAEQARIEFIPTKKARVRVEKEETAGMAITAAAEVDDYEGDMIAVLYGARLLNRNYHIVDRVKDIVYRGEQYKGQDIGTATIFQNDLRISTNVANSDGSRAIGTRVSQEVYDRVMIQGKPWIGRAFVVNAWYRTAYEPIEAVNRDIVGMLYVGVLEAPYVDMQRRVVYTFISIALLCVVLLIVIAYITSTAIIRPLKELLAATNSVAKGDLTQRVIVTQQDEVGTLAQSFNHMIAELAKTKQKYDELTDTLEQKVEEKTAELEKTRDHLIQSEKLTSLGRLAAGVAHEINNPLTSILINSHLVAEKIQDQKSVQKNLDLIIGEINRCSRIVKGLLEFSRQHIPKKVLTDISAAMEKTLLLFESQVLLHNVTIQRNFASGLPMVMADENMMKQVFTNFVLNALDAMPNGGVLTIASQKDDTGKAIVLSFQDTGYGIEKEHLKKIFDPFFTTKGTGGTGLGLAVSYGIIQQHGGAISVNSVVEQGTTFTITLPVEGIPQEKNKEVDYE